MRTFLFAVVAVSLMVAPGGARSLDRQVRGSHRVRPATAATEPAPQTIAQLRRISDKYASSVVTVDAYEESDATPVHRRGVGVLVSRSGMLFAPLFIVKDADAVIVSFGREDRTPAHMIGCDAQSQLAILHVAFIPDRITTPDLSPEQSERSDTAVVLVNSNGRAQPLVGTVRRQREKVGPLNNVLEVSLEGKPGPAGGVVFDANGTLVGISLATDQDSAGAARSTVYLLPASQIRQAIDRVLDEDPATDTPRPRPLTTA